MSDSNRVGLAYLEESSWGVIPSSAMTTLRYTGESLGFAIDNAVSDEIRSDRQVTDLIQTGASAAGDINFELSATTYNDFLRAALYSSGWTGVGTGATTTITSGATGSNLDFTLASAGNTITLGSGVTHGIVPGQWIKLTGSTSDDGYHKVTAVATNALTVESITGDEVLDETDAATITGSSIINGTTETSFVLEKDFTDITKFMYFTGMVPNNMNLSFQADSIATGSFSFMGKTSDTANATQGTGAANAATTTEVMNTPTNVSQIRENGTAMTSLFVQNLDISLANNLRGISAIGTLGYADMGTGRCEVTGSMSVYLSDMALYDKFQDATSTSLELTIADSAGNAYIVSMDNVEFTDGTVVSSGPNADVTVDLSYQALRDATYGNTIRIDAFTV